MSNINNIKQLTCTLAECNKSKVCLQAEQLTNELKEGLYGLFEDEDSDITIRDVKEMSNLATLRCYEKVVELLKKGVKHDT